MTQPLFVVGINGFRKAYRTLDDALVVCAVTRALKPSARVTMRRVSGYRRARG